MRQDCRALLTEHVRRLAVPELLQQAVAVPFLRLGRAPQPRVELPNLAVPSPLEQWRENALLRGGENVIPEGQGLREGKAKAREVALCRPVAGERGVLRRGPQQRKPDVRVPLLPMGFNKTGQGAADARQVPRVFEAERVELLRRGAVESGGRCVGVSGQERPVAVLVRGGVSRGLLDLPPVVQEEEVADGLRRLDDEKVADRRSSGDTAD